MFVVITRTKDGLGASLQETEAFAKAEVKETIENWLGQGYSSYDAAIDALNEENDVFEICIHPISCNGLFANIAHRSIRRSLPYRDNGDLMKAAQKTLRSWSEDCDTGVADSLSDQPLGLRLAAVEVLRELLAKARWDTEDYARGWDAVEQFWTV